MATRIIDLFAVIFFRTFSFLISVLPEAIGFGICKLLVRALIFFVPRYKKTALRNLALVFPDKTSAERFEIYLKSLDILAKNLFRFFTIGKLEKEEIVKLIDYSKAVECLQRLRAENPNVGVLLPNLHFGSFELAVHFKAVFDRKTHVLVRSFGLPMLDNWWNTRREKFGSKMFWRDGGFKEMVRCLKEGNDVAILADQNVKRNHAIFLPLFGIIAATTRSVALAVIKTECPVIVSGVIEVTPNKYELYFEEVETFKGQNLAVEERIEKITLGMHHAMENLIRKSPESWFWIHRRFKTRPKREDKSLYD